MSEGTGVLVKQLFRALWRLGRRVDQRFQVWAPFGSVAWGTHSFEMASLAEQQKSTLQGVLPSLTVLPTDLVNSKEAFRQLVRANFRAHLGLTDATQVGSRIDEAFTALRFLGDQMYWNKCSSSSTTDGVRVDVVSNYERVAEHTNGRLVHIFTYRVKISNLRDQPIKVIGRQWTIRNDLGQVYAQVPLGQNAVVGQQPIIPSGNSFIYHSGTELNTPAGRQEGTLLCHVLGNGPTETPTMSILAQVAPFPLVADSVINQLNQ